MKYTLNCIIINVGEHTKKLREGGTLGGEATNEKHKIKDRALRNSDR